MILLSVIYRDFCLRIVGRRRCISVLQSKANMTVPQWMEDGLEPSGDGNKYGRADGYGVFGLWSGAVDTYVVSSSCSVRESVRAKRNLRWVGLQMRWRLRRLCVAGFRIRWIAKLRDEAAFVSRSFRGFASISAFTILHFTLCSVVRFFEPHAQSGREAARPGRAVVHYLSHEL